MTKLVLTDDELERVRMAMVEDIRVATEAGYTTGAAWKTRQSVLWKINTVTAAVIEQHAYEDAVDPEKLEDLGKL